MIENTAQRIIRVASQHFGIQTQEIVQPSMKGGKRAGGARKRETTTARHCAMVLIEEETRWPLKKIAAEFSGRDHTAVIYARVKVSDWFDTNKEFQASFVEFKKKVQAELRLSWIEKRMIEFGYVFL